MAPPRKHSAELRERAVAMVLRTNELELGTWVFRTAGDAHRVLAHDRLLLDNGGDWLVNEILHYLKRILKRLDVTSRS